MPDWRRGSSGTWKFIDEDGVASAITCDEAREVIRDYFGDDDTTPRAMTDGFAVLEQHV